MEVQQLKRKYQDLLLLYPEKNTAEQVERRFQKFHSVSMVFIDNNYNEAVIITITVMICNVSNNYKLLQNTITIISC